MILTRKLKTPWAWVAVAQFLPVLAAYGLMLKGVPSTLFGAQFAPAHAVNYALSLSALAVLTIPLGMLVPWMSDRIWTRWGRRKPFLVFSDSLQALCLFLIPFSTGLGALVALWAVFLVADAFDGPRDPLVWEIIPPRQRARSTVLRALFANVFNLLFFAMLLGRFHDLPRTGFFSTTGVDGSTLLFWIGALAKTGAALVVALGIKEVYPPNRRRWHSDRKAGEALWRFLPRTFVKDCFLDPPLWPLYLLVLVSALLTVSLGVLNMAYYTEQLGYSFQRFGNLIALSALPGLLLLPLAFLADKVDRLKMLLVAALVAFAANLLYLAVMFAQGADQPSFYQVLAGGIIQTSLATVLGFTAALLLYDFLPRNRFGAAQVGPQLFRGLLRSGFALIVSASMVGWSL